MQMPSGLSARVVAVCTLILGVWFGRTAHAERRPVAVIDVSGEKITADLATELNQVLFSHPELEPIKDFKLAGELYGDFIDEDRSNIKNANAFKDTAENALAGFSLQVAQQNAESGELSLQRVEPVNAVLVTYSQLAFIRGQALLGLPGNAAEATVQLALAHRLNPSFVPDAARYLPDVVQSFNDAKKKWTGTGTLVVGGHGRISVDGREMGNAPAEVEVEAGPHVVWLAGEDRLTSGSTVLVEAAPKKTRLDIADAPADTRVKLRRARADLRFADAAARSVAMQQLFAILNVRDAVLLQAANGKLIYQSVHADKLVDPSSYHFSSLAEVRVKKPIELLAGLAPPKPKEAKPATEPIKPIVEKPWYARRKVQATIAIGVVAAIIGGYYLYKATTDDTVTFNNNPTFGTMARVRW
jgi:hypothetical protein